MRRTGKLHGRPRRASRGDYTRMWLTKGQRDTIQDLKTAIAQGKESHAYLLEGPDGSGKRRLATDIVKALNCREERGDPCGRCRPCDKAERGIHPDVSKVGVETGATRVQINAVREAAERLYITATEGGYGALIIDDAHLMTEEAANALLKTLEEPPERAVIILLSERRGGTLETVGSRCRSVTLKPMAEDALTQMLLGEGATNEESARRTARRSGGWVGRAVRALQRSRADDEDRQTEQIHHAMQGNRRDRFAAASAIDELFRENRSVGMEMVTAWESRWRDGMLEAIGAGQYATDSNGSEPPDAPDCVAAIEATEEAVQRLMANANPRTTLERMMLHTPDIARRRHD